MSSQPPPLSSSSSSSSNTCPSISACGTLLGTTASTSGDTYLFMWLTLRYFFAIPLFCSSLILDDDDDEIS